MIEAVAARDERDRVEWEAGHQADASRGRRVIRESAVDADQWVTNYRRVLSLLDFVAILAAIVLTGLLRFGESPDGTVAGVPITYPAAGALIGLVWWVALAANESRSREILGAGPDPRALREAALRANEAFAALVG